MKLPHVQCTYIHAVASFLSRINSEIDRELNKKTNQELNNLENFELLLTVEDKYCCWSGRLLVVAAGGRSRRTTECWRYSQHDEDSTTLIGKTSTNTSCRRPGGNNSLEALLKFCWVVGVVLGDLLRLPRAILEMITGIL